MGGVLKLILIGGIILKRILKIWNKRVWIGLYLLRIGSSGRLL
jgi:hypothetical protein